MHRQRTRIFIALNVRFAAFVVAQRPEERIERERERERARVPTNLMEHRTKRDVTRPRINRSILDFTTRRVAHGYHTRSSG